MSAFLNKVFKGKDGAGSSSKKSAQQLAAEIKRAEDEDPWLKTEVTPEEISELLRLCTKELKLRGLSTPFVLLPFRPVPDPGSPRNFIRNFFNNGSRLTGTALEQELRLTEPMVLCSVLKWCWSRLPGGVVTWEVYELFRVGESDSNMARDAFATFVPISVDSQARAQIIFDFFDLISAIAAHFKTNGLGGLKLSRLAGWWAFEHVDSGWGFEGGYTSWVRAADATMHLFFAYLRSLSPLDPAKGSSVPMLPTSLRALLHSVDYPPPKQVQLQSKGVKVVMTVEVVSPTPFALLRRAKHFQFREDDKLLQSFIEFEDPIQALTDECRRVLKCISQTNQSAALSLNFSDGLRSQPSWSNFQDIGFTGVLEGEDVPASRNDPVSSPTSESFGESFRKRAELGSSHRAGDILARPTTPSWADFLVAGFADQGQGATGPSPLLLPPDKQLPPIDTAASRVRSSQSNLRGHENLEPGELASVTVVAIDDAFWWVWMSSLGGEESSARKAVFGRCALAETKAESGKWLVIEEKVKGAAQATDDAAYIASKKGSKRGRLAKLGRRRSLGRGDAPKVIPGVGPVPPPPKPNIQPEVAARVQSVAAQIRQQSYDSNNGNGGGKSTPRKDSTFALQPAVVPEAASAMKWANKYDRDTIRDEYLSRGQGGDERSLPAIPTHEKPLPDPSAPTSPRQPVASNISVAPVVPTSPVDKAAPAPATTSPKSVQSNSSIPPHEKLPKTKGSRLGKLFGRKGERGGPASRSTTPLPEAPNPAQRSTPTIVTNGGGPSGATRAGVTLTDNALPPIPPKDPSRQNSHRSAITGSSSREEKAAQQAFSAFDGGPLTDMPAFIPEDTPESSLKNEPLSSDKGADSDGDVSPLTPTNKGLPEDAPVLQVDRWAQIRKNAAERVQDTSADDGDTSGEETIESRVARIKARVAELTGNIEGPPARV